MGSEASSWRAGRLEGLVAVVTGASSGIGAAVARLFLKEGARIAVMSRGAERLAAAMEALGEPKRILAMPGDVAVRADAERLVAEAVRRFGRLDVVVSNAGISRVEPFLESTNDTLRAILAVNVEGTFNICQAGARAMVAARRGGAIIVVGSTNGVVAEAGLAAYNASKGALPALVRTMAIELAPHDIRVNAVAPGTIESEMTRPMIESGYTFGTIPLGRIGTADEVAAPVLFLASREASYVTGATLLVDGGQLAINGAMPPSVAGRGLDEAG